MRKILKVSGCREMKSDGNFLRFNLPPLAPLPEDIVVRWLGQNEEFGIVEVVSDDDKQLDKAIKEMKLEEIDYDTSSHPKLDKESIDNISYGGNPTKALLVKEKYK